MEKWSEVTPLYLPGEGEEIGQEYHKINAGRQAQYDQDYWSKVQCLQEISSLLVQKKRLVQKLIQQRNMWTTENSRNQDSEDCRTILESIQIK